MLIATQKYRLLAISTVLIGIFCFSEPAGNAESENSETLTVLQSLYRDEMQAINNYQAYKDKAASEKYPNIARLFTALGASESIHARNFKACLVG